MSAAHVATMAAAGAVDTTTPVNTGTGDTTGADFVFFGVARESGATPTDSKGNSLTPLTRYNGAGVAGIQLHCADGSPTVGTGHYGTVGTATNQGANIGGGAFSGIASPSFDGENGSGGSTASPRTTGSLTPSEDGCLVIAAMGTYGAFSAGAYGGTPISIQTQFEVSAFPDGLAIAWEIQAGATARNQSFSWAGGYGNETNVTIAAFKPAGGGGQPSARRAALLGLRPVEIGRSGSSIA